MLVKAKFSGTFNYLFGNKFLYAGYSTQMDIV